MAGLIERWNKPAPPSPYQQQADAQQLVMLGVRNQSAVALAAIECAALVTYTAMDASRHVHLAAGIFGSSVPSCAEGVEMMAQAFDMSAALRIQTLLTQGR